MVQAYILIQTDVGKAATVAEQIAEHHRRHPRRGRHRPLRRHRPRRGPQRRRARQAGDRQDPGRPRHHPHPDLHGRPRLSRPLIGTPPPAAPRPARCDARAVRAPSPAGRRRCCGRRVRASRSPAPPAPRRRACACRGTAAGRPPSAATGAVDTDPADPAPVRGLGRPGDHRPLRAARARRRRRRAASSVNGVDWVVDRSSDGIALHRPTAASPAIEVLGPRPTAPEPLLPAGVHRRRPRALPAGSRHCSAGRQSCRR